MRNSLSRQKEYYNQNVAEKFDERRMNQNHLYKIETIEEIFEKYIDKTNPHVLELGGGTGIHAEHFISRKIGKIKKFTFSDLSEDMINVAKNRLKEYGDKVEYICTSAEEFKVESLADCVYISGAMHHFQSPVEVIKNCKKVLKKNGIFIICEPVITNPYAWPRVIFKPEEYGQFRVTSHNVQKWLMDSKYEILETKYLHYRSSSKFLSFITGFEKYPWLNWAAVMFIIAARRCSENTEGESSN